jgi:hypothetical protein
VVDRPGRARTWQNQYWCAVERRKVTVLNISGQHVTVDDSFLKLSPDEQQKTVDEIASSFTPDAPVSVNSVGRSFATGVPIIGGLLNKADAATNAALAPVLNPLFDEKDQLKGSFGERYAKSLGLRYTGPRLAIV